MTGASWTLTPPGMTGVSGEVAALGMTWAHNRFYPALTQDVSRPCAWTG
jgi:hypothetical protein